MSSSNQLAAKHLRGIYEREAYAQRNYDEAFAQALLDGSGSDAEATLKPAVCRARRKLAEARIERIMAGHLLAGHLLDTEAGS
jgi:hypothetical protein